VKDEGTSARQKTSRSLIVNYKAYISCVRYDICGETLTFSDDALSHGPSFPFNNQQWLGSEAQEERRIDCHGRGNEKLALVMPGGTRRQKFAYAFLDEPGHVEADHEGG
jgi:hypothetical protein